MEITVNSTVRRLPVTLPRLKEATAAFVKALGFKQGSISVVLLTGREMRRLNREALGHDYVTDVVTFDLREKHEVSLLDGEIYICPAEAERQARRYNSRWDVELMRYIAHGLLHLAGHDDKTDALRAKMSKMEDELLSSL